MADLAKIPEPKSAVTPTPTFEIGNSKIGKSGKFATTVFVWNLPAMATCPGASSWCSNACYNADPRIEKFPVSEWIQNWAWAIHRPDELRAALLRQIREAPPPTAVRIHSSGDFFSVGYIDLWLSIVQLSPASQFWAYTRSWVRDDLRQGLDRLRLQENVELFASWDMTMRPAPKGWRRSIVVDPESETIIRDADLSLVCPEQDGLLPNCASCGYCFTRRPGDVIFDVH